MDDTVTLTRLAFLQLLDALGNPTPDDPGTPGNPFGPFDPAGPVSRVAWVLLNPQPLPPRWTAQFTDALDVGPLPDRWHPATAVQQIAYGAMMQLQMAEAFSNESGSERGIIIVSGYIREVVDEWCGTGRSRWPWPKPRRWGREDIEPLDLLLAGREFQRLADTLSENPLQNDLAAAASQLFEVGLTKLTEQSR